MEPKTIILFATPYGGKDTHANILKNFFNNKEIPFVDVATGEYFRKLDKGNYTLELIQEMINNGKLAPDFIAESVVIDILFKNLTFEKSIIFNGFPRNLEQAKKLWEVLKFYGRIKIDVIYIEISPETATRIKIFKKNTTEMMGFMENKFVLHHIDGNGTIEEVSAHIFKALNLNSLK